MTSAILEFSKSQKSHNFCLESVLIWVFKNDSSVILRRGKRFVMRADEKLTAFLELETAIRPTSAELHFLTKAALASQSAPQGNQAEQSESEQR